VAKIRATLDGATGTQISEYYQTMNRENLKSMLAGMAGLFLGLLLLILLGGIIVFLVFLFRMRTE
jgi:hypothetical protein